MTTPQTSQNDSNLVNGSAPVDEENFLQLDEHPQARLVLADLEAAHRLLESGQLDPCGGEFVAVLRGQVAGHGKMRTTCWIPLPKSAAFIPIGWR
jgi:hypothetical protein